MQSHATHAVIGTTTADHAKNWAESSRVLRFSRFLTLRAAPSRGIAR
ncbi:hypothetical protein OHAE_823 [Ochrobactrum soli]|uniref:Uncharacterized protein n=1 Tax=Ochrobactrum soli TaxID=2448455 RepID=A0A2P9HLI6_9HYPH|nr:hypothetical protein OHAE_823 [[Ochrobactrum] soli]